MKKLLSLLLLLTSASVVVAQDQQPYEDSSYNRSSQQWMQQAMNIAAPRPTVAASTQSPPADVLPGSAAGIGPSSNTSTLQPSDYGYSYHNDLRQLNF